MDIVESKRISNCDLSGRLHSFECVVGLTCVIGVLPAEVAMPKCRLSCRSREVSARTKHTKIQTSSQYAMTHDVKIAGDPLDLHRPVQPTRWAIFNEVPRSVKGLLCSRLPEHL